MNSIGKNENGRDPADKNAKVRVKESSSDYKNESRVGREKNVNSKEGNNC